jgi:hypothetical protein
MYSMGTERTNASWIVVKLLSSLTYAALLINTSKEPPVIFLVSSAARLRASTSTISASRIWTLPVKSSFATRSSVLVLLRASPMTTFAGLAERCLIKAY